MLVVKFGGSILNGSEGLCRACAEVENLPRPLLLVVSAFADVTNRLEDVAKTALSDRVGAERKIDALFEEHRKIAEGTLSVENVSRWEAETEEWREQIGRIIEGLSIVGELSPRTLDLMVHFGERLSSSLVAGRLGVPVVSATDLLITDNNHRYARVDLDLSRERVLRTFEPLLQSDRKPDPGEDGQAKREGRETGEGNVEIAPPLRQVAREVADVIVTEGYIARGKDGEITTMGRESSDFSAALFGEFLHASEVRIYTGVPGIMTADPGVVPEAQTISRMSYAMAREIASLGAKVIHPRTVRPVERAGIPLVFNDLNGARTVIGGQESGGGLSITAESNASLLTFRLARADADLSSLLDRLMRSVPVIRTARAGRTMRVLLSVPLADPERLVRQEEMEGMILESEAIPVALLSCVREGGIGGEEAVEFLKAIGSVPLLSLWSDSTERSISALVHPDQASDIVRALHRQYVSRGVE